VVSLLNIPSDEGVYSSAGFSFLCLPVADGAAPTLEQVKEFVEFMDGNRVFDGTDDTFKEAGKVGLWTKADSMTYFDDLKIESYDTQ